MPAGVRQAMDGRAVAQAVDGLVGQIADGCRGLAPVLVGIHTRGVVLAGRLADGLRGRGVEVRQGELDISLYRDDLDRRRSVPVLRSTKIPEPVDGARVVLCDDVLFTGRTVRAALDAISGLGRPGRIELAVLVDRGHRELPIQADYVGAVIATGQDETVRVRLAEVDGADAVVVEQAAGNQEGDSK